MVRPRVFLDMSIDNAPVGRVIFELYTDTAPKTCENFRALCTGEKGLSPLSQRPLYYKNSIIHRSIKDFMIQGGDFTKRNGAGGESIYGGTFPDEDLTRPLDAEGLLCMANKGPDTNGSQFFVTLRPSPHLNGKHVVFGRVVRGYDEVVRKIAEVSVDEKSRPAVPVTVDNCGELVLRAKAHEPKEESAKREALSGSDSEQSDDSSRHRHSKKRRKRRAADSDGEEEPKHRRHRKSTKRKTDSPKRSPSPDVDPEHETEEQYDARLEREEKERLEAERVKRLQRLKEQEVDMANKNGVRFKGRGRMKYLDPELRRD